MTERRRSPGRGRAKRAQPHTDISTETTADPYLPAPDSGGGGAPGDAAGDGERTAVPHSNDGDEGSGGNGGERSGSAPAASDGSGGGEAPAGDSSQAQDNGQQQWQGAHGHRGGRRGRRNRRGRRRSPDQQQQGGGAPSPQAGPPPVIVPDGVTEGWFDPSREAGFIRRAHNSYLAEQGDAYVGPHLVRQYGLRRGDKVVAATGHDHRGRAIVAEITKLDGAEPVAGARRVEFQSLIASYPDRRLTLETGRSAKNGGPELTRRAIDLIAPIGYGQRALIVAPARAGKTMLLHAITEGIALNHPNAELLILLVDERPEEVSEAISWEVGEVVASSFDQPAKRHVEVVEMVLERARRMVEQGKDVVIVLDSLTRMARAFNTAERGTGRTLSGGLDSSAMARPKAFFGSARSIAPQHGGGSLTIIATALVETGSRMDDVIFEEFKGTGNCEIKLDRSLAEKRIFPAFDIATSGTRREEKLYREDQLQAIYMLRRGLQQMPPQTAMEWLIKRIQGTASNDALLGGL
ncbi:MAG: transcription termination factor Rho [Gemmatimonadaceae bacterium]|nr:transcription termination factor Rho [Gemmatimonadaceae bacterium]